MEKILKYWNSRSTRIKITVITTIVIIIIGAIL
jgi:hypothetical protein